ncbi:MAG: hypothetical protein ABSH20_27685 [Tepidisphaeraceae bacterium]
MFAVVLCGAIVVGRTFQETRPLAYLTFAPWQDAGRDRFSEMACRYVPLQPHLRGRRTVGWLSSYDHESGHRMMAQSMLAPTLVIDSDTPEVLIASFEDDARLDAFLRTRRLQVERRFGDGVAIVQRRRR